MADQSRAYDPEGECGSCAEFGDDTLKNECPASRRPCGHHCNCVWIHYGCDWCGARTNDDGDLIVPRYPPTCHDHGGTDLGPHGLGCWCPELEAVTVPDPKEASDG